MSARFTLIMATKWMEHAPVKVAIADILAAESRHIRLVAESPIPSAISDSRLPYNPIVACNAPFCELTGYPSEEVVGRNCSLLSGPTTEPWLTEEIHREVREHRPVPVEILNYKRNGQPFRNAVLMAPIDDEYDALHLLLSRWLQRRVSETAQPSCDAADKE